MGEKFTFMNFWAKNGFFLETFSDFEVFNKKCGGFSSCYISVPEISSQTIFLREIFGTGNFTSLNFSIGNIFTSLYFAHRRAFSPRFNFGA